MKDARATDVLANERTFLAYVRTALAFIAFGFVIARFSLFTREAAAILHLQTTPGHGSAVFGAAMAAAGILCGLFGSYRYLAGARALRAGTVSPLSDGAAIAIGAVIAAIGIAVAITIASYHP